MNLKSPLARFILIAGIIYFGSIAAFNLPPVEGVFNASILRVSEGILTVLLPDASIKVVTGKEDNGRRSPNVMQVNFSWTKEQINQMTQKALQEKVQNLTVPHRFTKYFIYQFFSIPLILFFALFLATPMKLLDKMKAVLYGGIILFVFLWGKLFILVLFSISNTRIGIYELSASTMEILLKVASILTLGVSVILVIVLWGIFALPKSRMLDSFQQILKGQ